MHTMMLKVYKHKYNSYRTHKLGSCTEVYT